MFKGNIISWKENLQTVVALSTTEAEFITLTEAIKEGVWLKGFLNDFGIAQGSVRIFCDNQSAIDLSKNRQFHKRTKHINVKYNFVCDEIGKGIEVSKVHNSDNAGDFLTK